MHVLVWKHLVYCLDLLGTYQQHYASVPPSRNGKNITTWHIPFNNIVLLHYLPCRAYIVTFSDITIHPVVYSITFLIHFMYTTTVMIGMCVFMRGKGNGGKVAGREKNVLLHQNAALHCETKKVNVDAGFLGPAPTSCV